MEDKINLQVGDLVKIAAENDKLGIIIKHHKRAGTPFYLIHEVLSNRQSWYPETSINSTTPPSLTTSPS